MPKIKTNLNKLKHPNSGKTVTLAKEMNRSEKNQKKLFKLNLLSERIMWFKERIHKECAVLHKQQVYDLIEEYLERFNDESEQLALENIIGQRRFSPDHWHDHLTREDEIDITNQTELEEFDTCGLKLPDFLDHQQMEILRKWNGELEYLQHFKLRRFSYGSFV